MTLLLWLLALLVRALVVEPAREKMRFLPDLAVFRRSFSNLSDTYVFVILLLTAILLTEIVVWLLGATLADLVFGAIFVAVFCGMPIVSRGQWQSFHNHTDKRAALLSMQAYLEASDVEDRGQTEQSIEQRLQAISLQRYFTATFVLVSCYLIADVYGLIAFLLLYYPSFQLISQPIDGLRTLIERITAVLTIPALAIAGNFTAITGDKRMRSWIILKQPLLAYEIAVELSAQDKSTDNETFFEKMLHFQRLQMRAVSVWLFIFALVVMF